MGLALIYAAIGIIFYSILSICNQLVACHMVSLQGRSFVGFKRTDFLYHGFLPTKIFGSMMIEGWFIVRCGIENEVLIFQRYVVIANIVLDRILTSG